MKLSVNEAKLIDLWARNCATIPQVLILKFAFWPEKFFFETGPWPLSRNLQVAWVLLFWLDKITRESFMNSDR